MYKIKKILLPVLAAIMCVMLSISAALLIPKNKIASANLAPTANGLNIGELIQAGDGDSFTFNKTNLTNLYNRLSGGAGNTLADVAGVIPANGVLSALDLRNKAYATATVTPSTTPTLNNDIAEYTIQYGGEQWIPVCLTKADGGVDDNGVHLGDPDKNNHVILTLWLANSNTSTFSNPDQPWTGHKILNPNQSGKNISGVYGSSWLHAYLNPGAKYSVAYDSDEMATVESSPWHDWYHRYGGDFIAQPINIPWQRTERYTGGDLANEACWKVAYTWSNGNAGRNIINNQYYYSWNTDKLWISTVTEAGDGKNTYIWKTSLSQRANTGGSEIWNRYADWYVGQAAAIPADGGAAGHIHINENLSKSVRPSFHLDLTMVEEMANMDKTFLRHPEDVTITYDGKDNSLDGLYARDTSLVPWYGKNIYASDQANVTVTLTQDAGFDKVCNAGTYGYSFKLDDDKKDKYVWYPFIDDGGDPDDITLKIEKRKIGIKVVDGLSQVQSSHKAKVTPSGLPTVSYTESLATRDAGGTDGAVKPELVLKYNWTKISTGGTAHAGLSTYDAPEELGYYKAVAEFKNASTPGVNYYIDPLESSEFEVIARKVSVPKINGVAATAATRANSPYTGSPIIFSLAAYNDDDIVIVDNGDLSYTIGDDGLSLGSGGPGTEYYFVATAVDVYTVTYELKSTEKAYLQWDDGTKDNKTAQFEITKRRLQVGVGDNGIAFVDSGANDPVNVTFGVGSGQWGNNIAVTFKLVIEDPLGGDTIALRVFYRKKGDTGYGTECDYNKATGEYSVGKIQDHGDYEICVELDTRTDIANFPNDNGNYSLTVTPYQFKIVAAKATFKPSDLTWQWTQTTGTALFDATNRKVPYNGDEYQVSVFYNDSIKSRLESLGVKIDFSYNLGGYVNGYLDGDTVNSLGKVGTDAGKYTVWLWVVSIDEDMYTYTDGPVKFEWEIEKAHYDQSKFKWQYYLTGASSTLIDVPADGKIPYPGNTKTIYLVLDTGYADLSLPATGGVSGPTSGRNIGKYHLTITGFTNSNLNYYDPVEDASVFSWTLDWEIVIATLALEWDWSLYPTSGTALQFMLPSVTNYSGIVVVKYYEAAGFSTSSFDPNNPGVEVPLSNIYVEVGEIKYYYAVAFLVDDSNNYKNYYKIDYTTNNWYQFMTVGSDLQYVNLQFDPDWATYDGSQHALASELIMSSPNGAIEGLSPGDFTLKYYKVVGSGKTALPGAPTDAGNYYVEISLDNPTLLERFLLVTTSLNYTIKMATIDVSQVKWGYRIDGGDLQEYIEGTTVLYFTAIDGVAQTYTLELMGLPSALAPFATYGDNTASVVDGSIHTATYLITGYNTDNYNPFTITAKTKLTWTIETREFTKPASKPSITFDDQDHDAIEEFCASLLGDPDVYWHDYLDLTITFNGNPFSFTAVKGTPINLYHSGTYKLTFSMDKVNPSGQFNALWADFDNGDYTVTVVIDKLIVNIAPDMWVGKGSSAAPRLTGFGVSTPKHYSVILTDTSDAPFSGAMVEGNSYRRHIVVQTAYEDDIEFRGQVYYEFKNLTITDSTPRVKLPALKDPLITFDGASHKITVSDILNFDSANMEIVLNEIELPTNKVGVYNIVIRLIGSVCWDLPDGSEADPTGLCYLTFTIEQAIITLPNTVADLTYNGKQQDAPLNLTLAQQNLVELSYTTKDGTPIDGKPKNAGDYTVIIKIKSEFADYVKLSTTSSTEYSLDFKINKAQITPKWQTRNNIEELETPAAFAGLNTNLFEYTFIDEDYNSVSKSALQPGKTYKTVASIIDTDNFIFDDGETVAYSMYFTIPLDGGGNSNGNGGGSGSFTEWLNANWWWLLIIVAAIIALIIILWLISNKRRRAEEQRREERLLEILARTQNNNFQQQPQFGFPAGSQQPIVMLQMPQQGENGQMLQLPAGQFDKNELAEAIVMAMQQMNAARQPAEPQVEVRTEYVHTGIDDDDGFYDDYTGYDDNNNNL